jgi:glucose-1-phosphate cytidylyltransferase
MREHMLDLPAGTRLDGRSLRQRDQGTDFVKAVILAGGYGTRISEETAHIPKPMIEIGGKPILWHIMKIYSHWGVNDFIICLGYKGYVIKEYFANYFLHTSDVTIDLKNNSFEVHQNSTEPWRVTLIDTGQNTLTGGRLKRIKPYVGAEAFCMTYGDGLSNVDISKLIEHHRSRGKLATVTAICPPSRFGVLQIEGSIVRDIHEKPEDSGALINGGFFVLEPSALDVVEGDQTSWELKPMRRLAQEGQLTAFEHAGFWQPMDTLREKVLLEELWVSGKAPWRVW